ncbi:MAG: hypothetical protein AB1485_07390 [Candidatus Thermoplasmatota archaeon]
MNNVIYPEYRGRRILPTRSAYRDLENLTLDLFEILDVLENGYDCPKGKRRAGIIERCLRKGKKVLRVVIAEGKFLYPDGYVEDVYWLIHVSEETFKKR